MRSNGRVGHALFVASTLALAASTWGCAFVDRNVKLVYDKPVGEARSANGQGASVAPPKDSRTDPDPNPKFLGPVRSGWGIPMAHVVSETDPHDWVVQAITAELKQAGFSVGASKPSGVELVVTPEILDLIGQIGYGACRLKLKVSIKRGDKELLDKTYYAEEGGTDFTGTSAGVQEALETIMKKVMTDFSKDLKGIGGIP